MDRLQRLDWLDRIYDEPAPGDARDAAWHGGGRKAARAERAALTRRLGQRIAAAIRQIAGRRRRLPTAKAVPDRQLARLAATVRRLRDLALRARRNECSATNEGDNSA